jgi:hypothetical protein
MGLSAGTGSPVWFRCYRARREHVGRGHVVTLTGRSKPYRPSVGHALGTRSTDKQREYECSCGYVVLV